MQRFEFPTLADAGIVHGFYSRQGGHSSPPFDSLNVGLHVGDDPRQVMKNRAAIKNDLRQSRLVSARQIHGDRIFHLEVLPHSDLEIEGHDALISNTPGALLMIQQADCQAVFLHDPRQMAIGLVHVGWRGSVANILTKTVAAMGQAFGSQAADLQAAISPSLGPCCAEFTNFAQELPADFHAYQTRPNHFDFWAISQDQLRQAGVKPERISVAGICTRCNENFFSYRRAATTGRFASVIGLG